MNLDPEIVDALNRSTPEALTWLRNTIDTLEKAEALALKQLLDEQVAQLRDDMDIVRARERDGGQRASASWFAIAEAKRRNKARLVQRVQNRLTELAVARSRINEERARTVSDAPVKKERRCAVWYARRRAEELKSSGQHAAAEELERLASEMSDGKHRLSLSSHNEQDVGTGDAA
jgi:hypothetical protein